MPKYGEKQAYIKSIILIDEENKHLLDKYSWFIGGQGYITGDRTINYKKERIKLHQLIMGKAPKGYCIDHINRNILDNRKENLRIVEWSINLRNKAKRKDSKQIYKGIQMLPSGKFSVKVENGRRIGAFENINDAKNHYNNYILNTFKDSTLCLH